MILHFLVVKENQWITDTFSCAVPNLVIIENLDDEDGVRERDKEKMLGSFFGEVINKGRLSSIIINSKD